MVIFLLITIFTFCTTIVQVLLPISKRVVFMVFCTYFWSSNIASSSMRAATLIFPWFSYLLWVAQFISLSLLSIFSCCCFFAWRRSWGEAFPIFWLYRGNLGFWIYFRCWARVISIYLFIKPSITLIVVIRPLTLEFSSFVRFCSHCRLL